MKTIKHIFYLLVVTLIVASCSRDYETPPFSEPVYDGASPNITISEFRAKYASATTSATAIDSGLILKATVVGNDIGGNIYKNVYIEDETGGMVIGVDQSSISSTYQLGQQIYLNMDGLSVLTYGGELEIGYPETTSNRVPWDVFTANASLDGWPDTTRFEPKVVSISDLDGNSSTLMNTLIELDSVYFENGGAGQYAVTTGTSTSVNQTLYDKDGNSIAVRTSIYADFAADSLPKGYGKVVGVLGRYNGTWQLMLRNVTDVTDFDGSEIETTPTTGSSYTLATSVGAGTYVFAANVSGTYKILDPLGESYTYGYMYSTDGTLTNNTISASSTEEFTISASTNGYTIQDVYGRYIYMSGTYNSFNVTTTMPSSGAEWTFTMNSDGTVTIKNVTMSKYIQYSTSYSSYGSYSSTSGVLPTPFKKE